MDDLELIKLYLAGSEKAFAAFYTRHKDKLIRYIYFLSFDKSTSEDVCATSWEKFICKCSDIKSNPVNYLFCIARHEVYKANRLPIPTSEQDDQVSIDSQDFWEQTQSNKILFSAIEKLSPAQKEAFLLKHLAEMTLEEVSQYQKVSKESAKSRIRYGVAKLKTMLQSQFL